MRSTELWANVVFVVIDRKAHRKRTGFLRALLREVRNEHVVAHEPRAVRGAEIAPRCFVGRVVHECGKRAATAVVITSIVQINNAVTFHVGLTGEEIDAEEFGGRR
jgi:anti-sigma factor RsiW